MNQWTSNPYEQKPDDPSEPIPGLDSGELHKLEAGVLWDELDRYVQNQDSDNAWLTIAKIRELQGRHDITNLKRDD